MIELSARKRLHGSDGDINLDVDMKVASGEFLALFGPSGAGKTTLLRCLAGLAAPDGGRIVVDGEVWFDSERRIDLPPQRRQVGFVFQDYALFPNMTVRQNLEFAAPKGENRGRIAELLEIAGLAELADRRPETLSGGQRQRVALARALARQPRLLLLDEPLSALDGATRLRLQDEILRLHRLFGITTLIVSHDLGEVFKLADRVAVLEKGRIAHSGKPADTFSDRKLSGKFQFSGEVLEIEPNDVVYAVTVLVGNQLVKVIATYEEIRELRIGSKVMLLAKAFNPMLVPL